LRWVQRMSVWDPPSLVRVPDLLICEK